MHHININHVRDRSHHSHRRTIHRLTTTINNATAGRDHNKIVFHIQSLLVYFVVHINNLKRVRLRHTGHKHKLLQIKLIHN